MTNLDCLQCELKFEDIEDKVTHNTAKHGRHMRNAS